MKRYPGLTIIELAVVLCIVSILLVLTFRNLTAWVAITQLDKDRDNFAALIYTARAAAVHLNQHVILCPGSKSGCANRDTWHDGAIVFADQNRNRIFDEGEHLVSAINSFKSRVTWRSFRNRSYLRFLPRGVTDWQNGHFKFCSTHESATPEARQLVLNAAGRLYFSHDEDGDGVHEDVQGRDLVC